jgi:MFS family permease
MQPLRGLDWAGTAYHVAVILAGAAFIPVSLILFPVHANQVGELLYLAAFTQIAALMPIRWHRGFQVLDTLPLIAVALYAPGGGVALVSWLCTFDGRRPSANLAFWKLLYNRSRCALEVGVPSILITLAPLPPDIAVPVKTILLAAGTLLIGYPLTAGALAFFHRENFWSVLASNVGISSVRSVVILAIGGGALYIVLQVTGGYLLGIGLLGLLVAVRSNMLDAQRQQVERIQTLELMAQSLDARDSMTELHSQRVSDLATRLAEVLGLGSIELERIRVAGLLHDVGKIGVPDSVLKKPGPLSHDEWLAMRRHPDIGADLIAGHSALEAMAPAVRFHHERWNGSGYPSGLKGAQAPLGARIIAVADSFDTITGPRIYRRSVMTPLEAVDEISVGSGEFYDPDVVNALRSLHSLPELRTDSIPDRPTADELTAGMGLLRRHVSLRWFSGGIGISSLGDPLTAVAVVVTAYSLTKSPAVVAAVYVLRAIATLLAVGALGGLVDRLDRRELIVVADLARALCLLALPFAIAVSAWWLLAAVVFLGAAGGLGQAAREAALPGLVRPQELGAANGVVGSAITGGQAIGYPMAAAILWLASSTTALFVIDACTFIVAAGLTAGAGSLGGRIATRSVTGAVRAAWSIQAIRLPLLVTGAGAFLIATTLPTLVVVSYELSQSGARAYTVLEVVLTAGMVAGAVLMAYVRQFTPHGAVILGLGLMGCLSIAIGLSSSIVIVAVLLFLASIGNQVYVVANRTQLQQAATGDRRGSVMATRAVVAEAAVIMGSGTGGVIAGMLGGRHTYALAGLGMLGLVLILAIRPLAPTTAIGGDSGSGAPRFAADPLAPRRG